MELTPNYHPASRSNPNFKSSKVPLVDPYQHLSKSHFSTMYSTPQIDSASTGKPKLLNTGENGTSLSLGMYQNKQSLNVDTIPKKKNFWQSILRNVTNNVGEHFSRGTGSLIKNWANMSNPLSVTVVSQDFYKSLQQGKDHQLVNPVNGLFTTKMWNKDSHNSDEILTKPKVLYDNEIVSDSEKKFISDSSKSDHLWWEKYKNPCIDFNRQHKDSDKDQNIVNSVNKSDIKKEDLESNFSIIDSVKDLDTSANFGNTLHVNDEPVMLEKPEPILQTQQSEKQKQQQPQSQPQESAEPSIVTTMLSNAFNKVVSSVVDLLPLRPSFPDPEPTSLFTKRACSPKPRPKKLHNISNGRGRGRAKSQLRRSGVSQTHHRKEHSRYDQSEDIKSDIDNWEELDYTNNTEDEEDIEEDVDVTDFAGSRLGSFTLADVKPKKQKPKKAKNSSWTQLSVAISVQSLDEDGELENRKNFRSRLISESSVDSEDSYCIVFKDDECSDDDSDSEYDEQSSSSSSSEAESEDEEMSDTDVEVHPSKVRFNLTPIIHPMIHWNFAYRAARPGPWEEMARDRVRFRSRINCLGKILDPVLAGKHRMRIWHERFDKLENP